MRTILHVDMDAFFASVEQLHHPEWRGRPVIVGAGPRERGVVSTCSYEARRFGVRSAMPSRTAFALCPHAVFTRPDMALYRETSDRCFEIFSHYSPAVEGVSIDEAFLDITGTIHLHGSPAALGEALRAEIRRDVGVTCSVGIATNRLLAKIGSEQRKPDGLTVMPTDPREVAEFLAPRPLGILWGVGAKTAELLRPYGIVRCGDVQRLAPDRLAAIVGAGAAEELRRHAFGISDDTVRWLPEEEKSVSREHTFDTDVSDRATIRAKLLELVTDVGRSFRRGDPRWAKTAKLKLRDAAFRTITRQTPFASPARDDLAFREAALKLFDTEPTGSVRLIGFGVTNFQSSPDDGQPDLFASPDGDRRIRNERLSEALDALRNRGLL